MTAETLKIKLTQIKKDNYVINGKNLYYSYGLYMLKHIGSTDATLRDELIYDVFAKWVNQNRFSTKQIQTFLEICIDDQHLMKCVGNKNDDTVFTRTFSALIIALILYSNNQKRFLSDNVVVEMKNIMIEYYTKELDLRGYIENKGWAHSVAHGADVIDELAQSTALEKEDLKKLLMIFQFKICQGKYVYIDGEPDRISVAVRSIFIRNEIDEYEMVLWVESFKKYNSTSNSSIESYHQRINITNFLKSLYFALKGYIQEGIIGNKIQDLIINI